MTGNWAMAMMVVLNAATGISWFLKKDPALGIVFICYAVSTACFLYKGVTV